MLVDKYRPKTLDNIKLNEKNLDTIIKWCNSWLQGIPDPEKGALLLIGHPGIGKTTIARAITNDAEWALIELNASDLRTKEQLKNFNPNTSLFESQTCILFDEIDSNKGDSNDIIISKLIKSQKHPIILTANNQWKVPKGIKSLCEVVQIYRPSINTLKNHLQEICYKERLNPSKEVLEAASQSQDFRLALNMIESNTVFSKIPHKPYLQENTRRLFVKDIEPDFEDSKSLLYWIDENAFRLYDKLDLNDIYEILSKVDILKRRGQISMANSLLKTIPKTSLEQFELYPPIFKKDQKPE